MSGKLIPCKTCDSSIAKKAKTCPYCGAKNKGSNGTWWKFLISLPLIYFAWIFYLMNFTSYIPECDSTAARVSLGNIVEERLNTVLLKVDQVEQTYHSPEEEIRRCKGFITTSSWERTVNFKILKNINNEFWVQIDF